MHDETRDATRETMWASGQPVVVTEWPQLLDSGHDEWRPWGCTNGEPMHRTRGKLPACTHAARPNRGSTGPTVLDRTTHRLLSTGADQGPGGLAAAAPPRAVMLLLHGALTHHSAGVVCSHFWSQPRQAGLSLYLACPAAACPAALLAVAAWSCLLNSSVMSCVSDICRVDGSLL